MRRTFRRRFAATQSASVLGRAIPFGIGAVIGGYGNRLLGGRVVRSARNAFGPPPSEFPQILERPMGEARRPAPPMSRSLS